MIDLDRLKELEKKATPGEWRFQGEYADRTITQHIYTAKGTFGHPAECKRIEDAEFITELRNFLPAIIRELEAGRKEALEEAAKVTLFNEDFHCNCHDKIRALTKRKP